MDISILTVIPELYSSFVSTSLIGRAHQQGIVHFDISGFRDYAAPKERIDAPTFGPGAGMLIKPEIIDRAIADKEAKHGKAFKVFLSPQGKRLNQKTVKRIAESIKQTRHMLIVAGRYEGMDVRVEQHYADEILSVGDFVTMGGDIPAMLFLESLLRLLPGVVGKQESVEHESFSGPFIDYPEYTEPVEWKGMQVPDIVRSGNHKAIELWRMEEAAKRSVLKHFNWVRSSTLTLQQRDYSRKYIPSHYLALLHDEVLVGKELQQGTTSVTSIDIHDIARTSATYGMQKFFIVTPLIDQQKIVRTLLDFWQAGVGVLYNSNRHDALNLAEIQTTLDKAVAAIELKEGKRPLLIATAAREVPGVTKLSYYDQEKVWASGRPVLLIFGTGQGITPECLGKCDYVLSPVIGFSEFNHLSVRSAAAIVCDRWLGINEKVE
jgi:tRNA (guanine37-N1)-methyltransferase